MDWIQNTEKNQRKKTDSPCRIRFHFRLISAFHFPFSISEIYSNKLELKKRKMIVTEQIFNNKKGKESVTMIHISVLSHTHTKIEIIVYKWDTTYEIFKINTNIVSFYKIIGKILRIKARFERILWTLIIRNKTDQILLCIDSTSINIGSSQIKAIAGRSLLGCVYLKAKYFLLK